MYYYILKYIFLVFYVVSHFIYDIYVRMSEITNIAVIITAHSLWLCDTKLCLQGYLCNHSLVAMQVVLWIPSCI